MNYPGPGTQIAGAYALTTALLQGQSVVTPPGANFQGASPFQLGFSTNPCNTLWRLQKLAAGDSYTQGYLSGYVSSSGTNTHQIEATGQYLLLGSNTQTTNVAGSRMAGIALTGGPLVSTVTWFLFPDLRQVPTQGIAQSFVLDLSTQAPDATGSLLAQINAWNSNVNNVGGWVNGEGLNGVTGDFLIKVHNAVGGSGDAMVLYNPTLTLFSAVQYAWRPLTAGGISIAPELLALGMFGGRRNA